MRITESQGLGDSWKSKTKVWDFQTTLSVVEALARSARTEKNDSPGWKVIWKWAFGWASVEINAEARYETGLGNRRVVNRSVATGT